MGLLVTHFNVSCLMLFNGGNKKGGNHIDEFKKLNFMLNVHECGNKDLSIK